jgi:hypothetical protein
MPAFLKINGLWRPPLIPLHPTSFSTLAAAAGQSGGVTKGIPKSVKYQDDLS